MEGNGEGGLHFGNGEDRDGNPVLTYAPSGSRLRRQTQSGTGMLKHKLLQMFSLLVLLVAGVSGLLGWQLLQKQVVDEAQKQVQLDLGGAWALLDGRLREVETIVRMTALKHAVRDAVQARWEDAETLDQRLDLIQEAFGFDFLHVVGRDRQLLHPSQPSAAGTETVWPTSLALNAAMQGQPLVGFELISAEDLERFRPELAARARLRIEPTARARPTPREKEDRGLVMVAAIPLFEEEAPAGAVIGGVLLNRNDDLVDRIVRTVYKDETYHAAPLGSATIFLEDVRVATTIRLPDGKRALGTRVSQEVADRVLGEEAPWIGPAFVVQELYLSVYEPIRDLAGQVVGMLYVGRLERPYRDLRQQTLLTYALLCLAGLAVALLLALVMAARLSRPIHALVEASGRMHRGEPHATVQLHSSCREIEALVESFNEMAETLEERQARLNATNAELERNAEALTTLNRSYMDMLGFVSHELKSPVASMQNYAYLLKNETLGPLTERQGKAIASFENGINRLVEMVKHYLNLSRIESGEFRPMRGEVRLWEDVLEPLLDFMEPTLQAREMPVETDLPDGLVLFADSNMVSEVFENLLSNACKYGRVGGKIRIAARVEGEMAHCSVWNEGPGFTEEEKPRLFMKFSRLENAQSANVRGTGLGLFIILKIVEAHGGSIDADSEPGAWAEIRFTLPVLQNEAAAGSTGT